MKDRFKNDIKHNWIKYQLGSVSITYIGRYKSVKKLFSILKSDSKPNIFDVKNILVHLPGNFGIVAESNNWILGIVDRISSYDLFYTNGDSKKYLSNSSRILLSNSNDKLTDSISLLELKMAGYVTGRHTVSKNISKLSAGQVILIEKNTNKFNLSSYFSFYTPEIRYEKDDILIEELDSITNKIILRNVEDANGRTIWVPLSGGLDSRLVICKLKQAGYDNIRTYSYGIKGNYDAIRASEIARVLGVKWDFIPTSTIEARMYFISEQRKKYWEYSDGLYVVPNLHGMFGNKHLVKCGEMRSHDVVINGQSGDFITGQHIPYIDKTEVTENDLINCIIKKHYSLRKDYLLDADKIKLIKERIKSSLKQHRYINNKQDYAKSYEYWEWKERQVKRVVHGQKNYDYFELKWELPMWDLEYINFWINLPISQKFNRKLFTDYLQTMNFYKLFSGNNNSKNSWFYNTKKYFLGNIIKLIDGKSGENIYYKRLDENKTFGFTSRYPRRYIIIQYFGNLLRLFFGQAVSIKFYKKLDWYSQYQYLYGLTGYNAYSSNWSNYKGPIPYMTDVWLNENKN